MKAEDERDYLCDQLVESCYSIPFAQGPQKYYRKTVETHVSNDVVWRDSKERLIRN